MIIFHKFRFPGAKNAPGVFHTIINNIPPHDTFVEGFAGLAWISRHKLAAAATIVIESDPAVHGRLVDVFRPPNSTLAEQFGLADIGEQESQFGNVRLVLGDAMKWLQKNRGIFNKRTVLYCDPPYLADVRSSKGRRYYGHEFDQEFLHGPLLELLLQVSSTGANVLISGRAHPLYDRLIGHWRRVDYQTRTRGNTVTESLWCSFAEPTELHDYRYLGRNFRERERIKRKLTRWRSRLAGMPILERRLIAAALANNGEQDLPVSPGSGRAAAAAIVRNGDGGLKDKAILTAWNIERAAMKSQMTIAGFRDLPIWEQLRLVQDLIAKNGDAISR